MLKHNLQDMQIEPCHFGIVFALGIESGHLEDLLSGAIRIRGSGFVIKKGGLKGRRTVIIRSGAGRKNAAQAAEVLIDGHRPQILISAGFAGGLCPALKRHDILLADSLVDDSGRQIIFRQALPSPDIVNKGRPFNEAQPSNEGRPLQWPLVLSPFDPDKLSWPGLHIGKLLTVDHVVRDPGEKQKLYHQCQALAVDMETFAVAEVCLRRNVTLCAIRVIHDAADDVLPPDVEHLLSQKTEAARLGAALGALWRRPGSIKDLWALKENSLIASTRLAKFILQLIEKQST